MSAAAIDVIYVVVAIDNVKFVLVSMIRNFTLFGFTVSSNNYRFAFHHNKAAQGQLIIILPKNERQLAIMKHKMYFTDSSYSFFTLPIELRLNIYEICMTDNDDQLVKMWTSGPECYKKRSSELLRTCKAVYEEALPVLYSNHIFDAESPDDLLAGLVCFGNFAHAHIKHIQISLGRHTGDRSRGSYLPPYQILENGYPYDHVMYDWRQKQLPRLPSLKSFTIHCRTRWNRGRRAADSGPQYAFLASLAGREVDRTHGLCRLMQIMKQEHNVSWELDLLTEESMVSPITGKLCVQLKTMRVVIKTEEVLVNGRNIERWVIEKVSDEK